MKAGPRSSFHCVNGNVILLHSFLFPDRAAFFLLFLFLSILLRLNMESPSLGVTCTLLYGELRLETAGEQLMTFLIHGIGTVICK